MLKGMTDHPNNESPPPTPEAVRVQLQTILASRLFVTATRPRRFLTYIVEQTLAGQTDAIKELVLGIEVFDRPADFDSKVDTIVRVEAGKLRKRLEEYYASEGAADPLRIEVPKGGYVPRFLQGIWIDPKSLPDGCGSAGDSMQLAEPRPSGSDVPNKYRYYASGILALLLIGVFAWWWSGRLRAPDPPPIPSIAVLPFLNLSPDPANEYFTDGLAEELTDALSNAGGLRVASRTSAFFFKGKQADIHEIGAKLRVAFVVEGSVRKQGEHLKVTAQLIRIDDGYHVWSGSFERKLADVFAVQQEIAGSLVAALQLKLTGAQTRRLRKTHTASQQAFDLYLQGKHFATSFAPGDLDRAERLFQQSIAADPAYPPSHAALAAIFLQANVLGGQPARELVSKASAAIHKALALVDELAEAHVILGTIAARHEYDWSTAELHLRHALELNPSSAMAHYNLAQNVLAPQGRWQEAATESRLASELDPLSPQVSLTGPWLAYLERRHEVGIEGFRSLAAANSRNAMASVGLGFALIGKGDYPAALEIFQQLQRSAPASQMLAFIGYIQARLANPVETRKILMQLLEESKRKYVSPVCIAVVYMGLGDADGVFRYFESAREQQDSFLVYTRVFGMWDPFRNDPRYLALLTKLRLTDEQIQKNQTSTTGAHR